MENNRRISGSLDQLYNIVNDLWGSIENDAKEIDKTLRESKQNPAAEPKLRKNEPEKADTGKNETNAAVSVPELPPFEKLWHIADETVDWTDALVQGTPRDGLTEPELWRFYHEKAEAVLNGETEAYREVLQKAKPLGDLVPYAHSFQVKVDNGDRLSVCFETMQEQMLQAKDARQYLAAVSLRAARDLMALLPVTQVQVTARAQTEDALSVLFERTEMQKVRFSFVEPIAFCEQCGGVFSVAEKTTDEER